MMEANLIMGFRTLWFSETEKVLNNLPYHYLFQLM